MNYQEMTSTFLELNRRIIAKEYYIETNGTKNKYYLTNDELFYLLTIITDLQKKAATTDTTYSNMSSTQGNSKTMDTSTQQSTDLNTSSRQRKSETTNTTPMHSTQQSDISGTTQNITSQQSETTDTRSSSHNSTVQQSETRTKKQRSKAADTSNASQKPTVSVHFTKLCSVDPDLVRDRKWYNKKYSMITQFYEHFKADASHYPPESTYPKISQLINCVINKQNWIMNTEEISNTLFKLNRQSYGVNDIYLLGDEVKYLIEILTSLDTYNKQGTSDPINTETVQQKQTHKKQQDKYNRHNTCKHLMTEHEHVLMNANTHLQSRVFHQGTNSTHRPALAYDRKKMVVHM